MVHSLLLSMIFVAFSICLGGVDAIVATTVAYVSYCLSRGMFLCSDAWGVSDADGLCLHIHSMWLADLHKTVAPCGQPPLDVKEYVGTTLS